MTVLKLQTNRHSCCRKAFNFNDRVSVLYIVKIRTLVLGPHFLVKYLICVTSATSAMQLRKQGATIDAPLMASGKNVLIKSPRLEHICKIENIGDQWGISVGKSAVCQIWQLEFVRQVPCDKRRETAPPSCLLTYIDRLWHTCVCARVRAHKCTDTHTCNVFKKELEKLKGNSLV